MPTTIRIMNWNPRVLSGNKLTAAEATIGAYLEQVIKACDVDAVIFLEVSAGSAAISLYWMSVMLNRGNGTDWRGYLISDNTGGESYGLMIRDFNLIRPVVPLSGPAGSERNPLSDLTLNVFQIWPTPDFAVDAYPLLYNNPKIPLAGPFAGNPRTHELVPFVGMSLANGGFSEGRGYRLPAMPILAVANTGAGLGPTFIPIIVCHYGAVRSSGSANPLARGQIAQQRLLHIAQMFIGDGISCGCIAVQTAAGGQIAVPIQELIVTGDFNVDFLQNSSVGTRFQMANAKAYRFLTTSQARWGTRQNPLPVPSPIPVPLPPVPFQGHPIMPDAGTVPALTLLAAVTEQGTILGKYPRPYPSAAFDNFFYCGTNLNSAVIWANGDAGEVTDIPAMIGNRTLDVSAGAAAYGKLYHADAAPDLQDPMAVLDLFDGGIGANLLSDHLPVILQFTCP